MTDIEDKSLIRCTVKKSASVLWKWIFGISCVIVTITTVVLSYVGACGIANALTDPTTALVTAIVQFITGIPWYWYAEAGAVLAIPVYSFLWCVSRELTEDDWKSESANNFAVAFAAVALAVSVAFAAVALAFVSVAFAAVAFAAVAVAFADADAVVPVTKITVWYYVFRFTGAAWNHYLKAGAP